MELKLRAVTVEDETEFLAAHEAMVRGDDFFFALSWEPDLDFADYVQRLDDQHHGIDLGDGLVPATFLVADVGGVIVGRTSIRHELNDFLFGEGGHIGYGVLRGHRRRGYAKEILRQSLDVLRRIGGIDRALITCDFDNEASARTIVANGGVEAPADEVADPVVRRFWITL